MTEDLKICDGKFINKKSGYSVVFNDDGRVAYAYLLDSAKRIVSDVWLYNRCEAPEEPEWHDINNMPFANPVAYCKNDRKFSGVNNILDVSVAWSIESDVVKAKIIIFDKTFAILVEGIKPGKCCMARIDGPLAKVLGD